MTPKLAILFVLLFFVFVFLIWGRWRYDLVAFSALVAALLTGVVPKDQAFSGFGHPATVIIGLVLILSRALYNSGAIGLVVRYLVDASRSLSAHIAIVSGFAGALSTLMNNVAALALLMPVELEAARKAKRSAARSLMPLSFATILGGMVTLIGTPPNIVIAEFRNDALGDPYRMFDFAPVGLACAAVGIIFIAFIGWRLIPDREEDGLSNELINLEGYIAEVTVADGSSAIGKRVRELDEVADDNDAAIIGLIRRGKRMPGLARTVEVRKGDVLVLEAGPEGIDKLVGALGLEYGGVTKKESTVAAEDMALMEVVAPEGARIVGRSAYSLRLLYRHGVVLLGVSRAGERFKERIRQVEIRAGDVLLLLGPAEQLSTIATWLGCLPLAERDLPAMQRDTVGLAIGIFGAAIVLASIGVLYLPIALALAVVLMVAFNIVPLRQVYDSVEWPVIVLLGSMIPLGGALEATGGTALIAEGIVDLSEGFSPVVVLVLIIVVTMTLSDVMNNVATAVIAAPVAIEVAEQLGVNPDPLLMGVAIGASCAFLTPIGHKNNTLILGPGGYRFGDYWRMGLPLEILIIAVATPMILWVWPL